MKLILRYLRPLRGAVAFGLTIKVLATLAELSLPYILSYILDTVVPMHRVFTILLFGGVMILCALFAMIGNMIANRNASKVARNACEHLRHDLFDATMRLSSSATDRFTVPSLEARLTSDTYHVHQFIGSMQRIGVRAPILLVGGIAITLILDFRLSLIMIATLPVMGILIYLITRKGMPLFTESQKAVDGMVRVVREDCQGIRVVKALSMEDFENRRYDRQNRYLCDRERKASVTMAISQPLMSLFLNLGLAAVIFFGAYFVNADLSKPGRIIAFIQYFTLLSGAMTTITRIFVQSTKSIASANRISEVLDFSETRRTAKAGADGAGEACRFGENETAAESAQTGGDEQPEYRAQGVVTAAENAQAGGEEPPFLEFDDVCFSYNGKQDDLSHVSFRLKRGGTLGIIGATGSGKTTLLSLLMRFYDARSGSIYIGGKDLYAYSREELYPMFGVAMQNDFISADTVAENIRFGRDLQDGAVRRAAQLAQAADFIEAFPDGYDHMLTAKGTNLSGGQRQRILIARALAASPQILILDDASSALDYKTDAALRRAIRECVDTTSVVVAQRVSSVMYADLILVLDHGRVIGAGDHGQLLSECAAYREISESQMGGAFLE